MKELEIQRLIGEGFNCSQIVAGSFSTDFGMDVSLARKVGACFGGGMDCGETCGAVTGALMVLGLKYGNESPNTPQAAAKAREKSAEFRELFLKKYDSTI